MHLVNSDILYYIYIKGINIYKIYTFKNYEENTNHLKDWKVD